MPQAFLERCLLLDPASSTCNGGLTWDADAFYGVEGALGFSPGCATS